MRIIVSSIAAAVVLGIGAALVLAPAQRPAYEAFATSSTRVGDPGANLVGTRWTGLNRGESDPHKKEP